MIIILANKSLWGLTQKTSTIPEKFKGYIMYNIKQATNVFLEMETILFSIHAKRQYLQLELEYNYFLHWQNKENHFMYLYCMVLRVGEPVCF